MGHIISGSISRSADSKTQEANDILEGSGGRQLLLPWQEKNREKKEKPWEEIYTFRSCDQIVSPYHHSKSATVLPSPAKTSELMRFLRYFINLNHTTLIVLI